MTGRVTETTRDADRWNINDQVLHLREWGTQRQHELPSPEARSSLVLGAGPSCYIRVDDAAISGKHLRLEHTGASWVATDLESTNGTHVDGVRTQIFELTPGCEIRTGALVMIAESAQWLQLRNYLQRVIGWKEQQLPSIDLAMRSIRRAALQRGVLWLDGQGDLAPLAYTMHRFVYGAKRPFVMCDRRRADTHESVRAVANKTTATKAFAAAQGGSVCVRTNRLPIDLHSINLEHIRPAMLVVLGPAPRDSIDAAKHRPIEITPLGERAQDLPRIIDEYTRDAATELKLAPALVTPEDRTWICRNADSLSEIQKSARRILALRHFGSFSKAARRLGMACVSLARWTKHRNIALGQAVAT